MRILVSMIFLAAALLLSLKNLNNHAELEQKIKTESITAAKAFNSILEYKR